MKKHLTRDHSITTHLNIIRNIRKGEYDVIGIEKYIALFLCCIKLLFPSRRIRNYTKTYGYETRNKAIEIYLIIKIIILGVLLLYPIQPYALIIASYILLDVTQYLLGLIFLSNIYTKFPSIKRNFAHLVINIFEITLGFAILYLSFEAVGSSGIAITTTRDALYFSFVTFSTIGYGDITPISPIGKTLVILETLISFLFVTIIASSFVSGLEMKSQD